MKRILVFLVCFPLITVISFGQEKQADDLLSNAIYQEEVKGNLKEAILIYKDIIKKYPEQRAISAEALFHLGLSNEKLGNKKAKEYYETLVNSFGDQPKFVRIAKERLSKLLVVEKVSKAPLVPTFTKIQIPVKLDRGAQLSPDGKKLTFSSTMYEGSIWTVPVHGKVGPNIAGKPEKLLGEDKVWAWGHVWSADGKWIAYNYMKNDKEKDIFVDEVHVITSTGGEPKKITLPVNRGGSYHLFQYSLSLSPDGKVLAYASRDEEKSDKPKESYIYTIPVNGGIAKRLTDSKTWLPAFSPDGKKIAYIKKSSEEDELWVIPSLGGTPVKVCDLGGTWGPPIWSPESDIIAFLREPKPDEKCKELWLVPLSETGSSAGLPIKIELLLESSMNLAGWTSDNKVGLLMLSPVQQAIYTIPSSGGKATQVTAAGGQPFSASWNNNGKKIYFTDKGNLGSVVSEGGEMSSIPVAGIEGVNFPVVSPDGKKVLFHGFKKGVSGMHIWTASIEGGEPTQVIRSTFNDDFIEDAFPHWSPDGKTICFYRHEKTPDGNGVKSSLCLVPADGGEVKVLISDPDGLMKEIGPRSMCWSPDGKSIVYYCNEDGKIKTIPLDNGEPQVLAELNKGIGYTWMTFSPDGKKILYTANSKIWTISLDGAEPVEIKTGLDTQPVSPAWSPDGEKIAFTTRKGGDIELWFMEDFLPLENLAQNKTAEATPKVMTNKKIWDDSETYLGGAPSPDGKYLSYVDWETGDLAIYEIATEKKRRLTNKESWDKSDENAFMSRWSPDSKQIVYSWYNGNGYCDLRIVGLDGSIPRILYSNEEVKWTYPYDWSPDGKQILAYFDRKDGTDWIGQIVLVSTTDGSERILKTTNITETGPSGPENMCFSPDGHYIVYDFPQQAGSPDRDIFLLSSDGSRAIPLVEHPSYDELLGWAPDGKNIIFASDRNGTFSFWNQQIAEGKPLGNPELVKSGMGSIKPLGFTKGGSFYYGYSQKNNNIYNAELDPETGEILTLPKRIITRFEGYNQAPSYSPDGKYLAYISRRFPLTILPDYSLAKIGGNVLCIKDFETGKEREIFPDFKFRSPYWSSDGRSVFVIDMNNSGSKQIDIQTGNVTSVLHDDNIGPQPTERSHDGKTIYYALNNKIIVRNLENGSEKEIYRSKGGLHIRLSPDGKWLAIQDSYMENFLRLTKKTPSLLIIPSAGGEPRELCRFEDGIDIEAGAPFTWTPDGKYILYSMKSPKKENEKWDLYRIPANGGIPEKLGIEMSGFALNLSVHPDGRHIAFSLTEQSNANIWVMENFLPKE